MTAADMKGALQYGPTRGLPCLLDRLTAFQEKIHHRSREDWGIIVGNGCQDLIWKVSWLAKTG
jgi:tryptophan aminotransferase